MGRPMRLRGRGFTLLEMLVVLTLLGLVAGAAVPLVQVTAQRSKEAQLRSALWSLRHAIDDYKRAAEAGSIARAAGDSGYPPDLQTLVEGVRLIRTPDERRIYFLRRIPRDPFAPSDWPPEKTWVLRGSQQPPGAEGPAADVFDVSSGSAGVALDGSRYRDW